MDALKIPILSHWRNNTSNGERARGTVARHIVDFSELEQLALPAAIDTFICSLYLIARHEASELNRASEKPIDPSVLVSTYLLAVSGICNGHIEQLMDILEKQNLLTDATANLKHS